jgi:hypothetical protein
MTTNPSMEDFDEAIRRLGEVFFAWVQSQVQPGKWSRATLEVRYASDGSYWNDKVRVETADRGVVSIGTTDSIREMLAALNHLRLVLGWYRLELRVGSDGRVTASYGYDPRCAEDPTFFND